MASDPAVTDPQAELHKPGLANGSARSLVLRGAAKASIILLALGQERASRLVQHFNADELRRISRSAADIGPVSAPQLESLVEDFARQFAGGVKFFGTQEELEKLFIGAFSEEQIAEIAAGETPKDLSLEIGANFYLGCAIVTSGDNQRAETFFQKVADSLDGELSRQRCGLPFVPSVVSRSWLVWALAERGEFDQAMRHGEVALEIAKEVGHPFNLAHIYYDLGYFHGVKGEFGQAVDALEQAYALIREWKLTYLSPFIMGFLGHVYAHSGRVAEGTSLLQQAVSDYQSMGLGLFRSLVGVQLGEALFLDNRVEEAIAATERALALARKRGERGHEAYAIHLLGEIAAHPDMLEAGTAQGYHEQARTLAETLGMRPLVAHCHLGLGRLYRQEGKRQEADEQVRTAATMYDDLGMRRWKEQAKALM